MRRLGGFVAVTLLVLLAVGCSDDEQAGSDGSGDTTNPPAEGTGPPAEGTGDDTTTTTAPPDGAASLPDEYVDYTSDQYAEGQHWLCHPANAGENYCDRDLTTTLVNQDGSTGDEPHVPAEDPTVDCFYVYPTISNDPGLNADLEPDESGEIRALLNQAARLTSVCEVYAPVYRQLTLGSLLQRFGGQSDEAAYAEARELAYADVLDAFRHYLANDNDGRGVILIGHSQGAGVLNRLLQEEFDGVPALTDRLVAAYLLGTSFAVPEGAVVGGDLREIPLCETDAQTGCVVTYASYPASLPPPDDALFGAVDTEGQVAACTNPAALAGGPATLTPYFTAEESVGVLDDGITVDTPWVGLRGVLTGECVERNGYDILEVTVDDDPTDERDRVLSGGLPPNWGLHLADVNLAMGDVVALAASQAEAFAG
jgi:hypothetical protein